MGKDGMFERGAGGDSNRFRPHECIPGRRAVPW